MVQEFNTKTPIAYHPGEDLLEEIEARWRTQTQFAEILWVDKSEINNIIKWRRNITARIASRIWIAFWTSAQLRMSLQNMYDLYVLSQNKKEAEDFVFIKKRAQEFALS